MAKLASIKTKETTNSVEEFLDTVPDEQKREDSKVIVKMMEKITKNKAKMWGPAIIGFGNKIYESAKTGRQIDWFKMGFSPRKANISLYLIDVKTHEASLKKLGKHKTGAGCIYINRLSDIDIKVLEQMIKDAEKTYG